MTDAEFAAELERIGLRPTQITAGVQRRWEMGSGVGSQDVRWILEPQYVLSERRRGYLDSIRRSVGLRPLPKPRTPQVRG